LAVPEFLRQPIRAEKTAGGKITVYLAGQPVKELTGSEKLKQLIKYIEGRKRTIDELQNQELYPWIDLQNLREFNKKVQVK